ncbi:ATP-binding cassette domain-containing protein, partial [Aliarcobacter butzleri]|uniref:ATP-binding cassette domain-containing protein n=1 Tax=Aliarcobacter butzleri TaxID=28197 RepID=UPI003AF51A39
ELRCIIGANGAGKSTMMNVVTGKTKPDSGEVIFEQAVNLLSMDEPSITQIGIGRKFQKPTELANHTVYENLELTKND